MNWNMDNPRKVELNQAFRLLVAVLMLMVVLLVSCQGQSILDSIFPQSDALVGPTPTPDETEQVEDAVVSEPTATNSANIQLSIWVPPQFNPYEDTEAANLLSNHFKAFMIDNPGVTLDIRVKATSGTSNMLDTLTYANQVAADALPSLVLLRRSSLEIAVEKGLIQPIEGFSTTIDEEDWYEVAREMAVVGGTAYGLPIAADALGLVYTNASLTSSQPEWSELIVQLDSLIFPAADPEALTTMALYLSAGGSTQDPQGQAFIDVEALTLTLDAYSTGLKSGLLSASLLDLSTDEIAWNQFSAGGIDGIITWTSRQLQNEELKFAQLPTLGESPSTLAKGWVWCLVENGSTNTQSASLLVEHMVDPDFLASWTPLSGYLPVRPSSVQAWENTVAGETINNMMLSANLVPIINLDSKFSINISKSVKEVLLRESSPTDSAQLAADSLEVVE